MYKKICFAIASWFGVGYCPFASGTCGSLVALPFIFGVAYFWGVVGIAIFALCTFLLGWIASVEVIKYTSSDPSLVVIDEVCGQALAFLFVGFVLQGDLSWDLWWIYLVGFGLFRLFDITKPWIIGKVDKDIDNAFGVMLDDVLAGLFAGFLLWGIVGGVKMTLAYVQPVVSVSPVIIPL